MTKNKTKHPDPRLGLEINRSNTHLWICLSAQTATPRDVAEILGYLHTVLFDRSLTIDGQKENNNWLWEDACRALREARHDLELC